MTNDNEIVQQWIFGLNQYVYYELPDNCPLVVSPEEIDTEINCASCRQPKIFGNCYTSRTIHDQHGFGYPVCEECYKDEIKEEERVKKEK